MGSDPQNNRIHVLQHSYPILLFPRKCKREDVSRAITGVNMWLQCVEFYPHCTFEPCKSMRLRVDPDMGRSRLDVYAAHCIIRPIAVTHVVSHYSFHRCFFVVFFFGSYFELRYGILCRSLSLTFRPYIYTKNLPFPCDR